MKTARTAIIIAILTGITAAAFAADRPRNLADRPLMSFTEAQQAFKSPGMAYAPFIFWFWDEPLDAAKMAEMSRVMVSEGFNPGYAHARRSMVGTPDLPDDHWLTDKWFTAFDAALDEAKAKGAYLGYCDEYWWPSFQAHGRVLKQHPELAAQSLSWKVIDVDGGGTLHVPESFFATAARMDAPRLTVHLGLPNLGKWIWDPNGGTNKHTCWMRKTFTVPSDKAVTGATIRLTVDNAYRLFLNGKRIGEGSDWYNPGFYSVTGHIRPGRNVIAVECRNINGPCGAIFGMRVFVDQEQLNIASDATWKTTLQAPARNWTSSEFDDSNWNPAREICGVNEGAWVGHDFGRELYDHQTIHSKTLRILGGGKPFLWKAPEGNPWRVHVFSIYSHPGIDGGATNFIDQRTGKAFVEIALQPYARQMGGELGKSVPGDFIDHEGDYGWKLAWSESLDRKYKERYKRDIRLWMPLMLDKDTEGRYARARWEWFDLVSDLYCSNFRAITDWNEKRGAFTTAHFWEGTIAAQVNAVGDHMKILRAVTMPGQDCLGTSALNVRDFKEIASVAEFGSVRAATELLGAGGWGVFTPEMLKKSANSITAWGMSHVIPHGVFTQRKLTGNPWMPDWYSESPIFPWMHLWNDFVTRASFINSLGHACPDVLLYNPIESAWALASADMLDARMWDYTGCGEEGKRIEAINAAYSKAMQDLTDGRVEFLVGDRKYVIESTVSKGRLRRGPLQFRTVVLPPLEIMPLQVAKKLVALGRQGGRVYALGSLPSGSSDSGMNDPEMARLMKELSSLPTFTRTENLKMLVGSDAFGLPSPIKFLSGAFPMLQAHRRIDGRDFYWLANNNDYPISPQMVITGAHGPATIWDCETGETRPVPATDHTTGSTPVLTFKPLQAYWLVFDPTQPPVDDMEREAASGEPISVDGPWTVTCDPSIQPKMEYPPKPGTQFPNGVKPLEDWSKWGLASFSGLLDYETTVVLPSIEHPEPVEGSRSAASDRIVLDLGAVHAAAELWVNDKPCGMRLWGPYEFDITGAAREGTNRIRVRVANLINNSCGDVRPSGILGPVRITASVLQ